MKNEPILVKLTQLKPSQCIHSVFNFNRYNTGLSLDPTIAKIPNCGTSGCLAGELPGITKDWEFHDNRYLCLRNSPTIAIFHQLGKYFDLSVREVYHLFAPEDQLTKIDPECTLLKYNSTLEEVQTNLKRFLRIKGISIE